MADVRKRKTDGATPPSSTGASSAPAKPKPGQSTSTVALFGGVTAVLCLAGLAIAGALYLFDPLQYLNLPSASPTSSSAPAASATGGLELSDTELHAYDGSDPDKPIYVAINGSIFDVSSGRSFYGPGGHYNHFAGRDATRAWVTECFDGSEQWTHDMRGVEEMFTPRYMDEILQGAAGGKIGGDNGDDSIELPDALRAQASKALKSVGKVGPKARARRREEDLPEARDKVDAALAHWVSFFRGNPKYTEVGRVLRAEGWEKEAPEPPPLCEKALKKKPIKGGKLEGAMQMAMGAMGGQQGEQKGQQKAADNVGMPDSVKEKLASKAKAGE